MKYLIIFFLFISFSSNALIRLNEKEETKERDFLSNINSSEDFNPYYELSKISQSHKFDRHIKNGDYVTTIKKNNDLFILSTVHHVTENFAPDCNRKNTDHGFLPPDGFGCENNFMINIKLSPDHYIVSVSDFYGKLNSYNSSQVKFTLSENLAKKYVYLVLSLIE